MNFVLENHTGLTILAKNGIIVIKRPLGSLWKWMKRWRDWDMRPHFSTKESGFFSFICPLCCYRLIVTTLSWNVCKSKLRRHKMGLQDQHNSKQNSLLPYSGGCEEHIVRRNMYFFKDRKKYTWRKRLNLVSKVLAVFLRERWRVDSGKGKESLH